MAGFWVQKHTHSLPQIHKLGLGAPTLSLNNQLWVNFPIPLVMMWLQIFRRGQPLPAGSGQVGGPGLAGWAW